MSPNFHARRADSAVGPGCGEVFCSATVSPFAKRLGLLFGASPAAPDCPCRCSRVGGRPAYESIRWRESLNTRTAPSITNLQTSLVTSNHPRGSEIKASVIRMAGSRTELARRRWACIILAGPSTRSSFPRVRRGTPATSKLPGVAARLFETDVGPGSPARRGHGGSTYRGQKISSREHAFRDDRTTSDSPY